MTLKLVNMMVFWLNPNPARWHHSSHVDIYLSTGSSGDQIYSKCVLAMFINPKSLSTLHNGQNSGHWTDSKLTENFQHFCQILRTA